MVISMTGWPSLRFPWGLGTGTRGEPFHGKSNRLVVQRIEGGEILDILHTRTYVPFQC
jgi:hypothetical protein